MPNNTNNHAAVVAAYMPLVLIFIAVIVLQKVLSKLKEGVAGVGSGLGLTDTDAEKKNDANVEALKKKPDENPFLPLYYKKGANWDMQKYGTLTRERATEICKEIASHENLFSVNPDGIRDALAININSKVQLSFLAEVWATVYNGNTFFAWLNRTLSGRDVFAKEYNSIIEWANNLPTGFNGKPDGNYISVAQQQAQDRANASISKDFVRAIQNGKKAGLKTVTFKGKKYSTSTGKAITK